MRNLPVAGYLMLVPGLAISGLFVVYPIVAAGWFSLHDWSGFSTDWTFVGLDNYRGLIGDGFFWAALWRSVLFLLGTVPLQLLLGLIIAFILNDKLLKLSTGFRTFVFLPVVTPAAVIGIIWTFLLSPFNGPINGALLSLGLIGRPVEFLGSGDTVLPSTVLVYVWKWLGLTVIYWLAALQTVPEDVLDVARLDNCKSWRLIIHVVLPIVLPFAIMIALISTVAALNVFPLIMSMTNGGPFFASEVIEVFIYRTAFASDTGAVPRLGYAAAAGVFFGIIMAALAILHVIIARRRKAS